MGEAKTDRPHQRELTLTLILCTLGTCFSAWLLMRIPSDAKNAFLFGLSKERLLMLSGFLLIFVGNLAAIAFRESFFRNFLSQRKHRLFLGGLALTGLFFVLLPEYRFREAAAYFTRLRPYLIWAFITSGLLWLYAAFEQTNFRDIRETVKNLVPQKPFILPALVLLLTLILAAEITGLGRTVESALWNKNGIPLQSIQLFFCLLIFVPLCKHGFFKRFSDDKRLKHFLIIWACSAAVWSLAALAPHFFAPGPYEPDLVYYPYSDAVSYDIAAQGALNGWGFNLRRAILKPTLTYITFLIRLISGGGINRGMLIQSALFAILPAIIYLFGTAIGGTGCGYLAAVFSLLKEWNALNTREVLTVHSRLTMSEFLVQILFAAFCYAVFRWLQRDGQELRFAAIAGGTLTLGMYTRFNFIAFLPAALLYLFIAHLKNLRALVKPLLIFALTVFLTAAPLLIRNKIYTQGPFSYLNSVITNVLIGQRFDQKKADVPEPTAVPEKKPVPAEKTTVSEPKANQEEISEVPEKSEAEINTSQITQNNSNVNSTIKLPLIPSIINHSMHNFITSALTIPMEPVFHDLEHLYQNGGDGLWRDTWQGTFSARQWLFIAVWTITAAIAAGALISRHRFAGGSLIYFWAVYCASIGFSRSSGGRYVVPMNWIPMLLLSVLCVLLIEKGKLPAETKEKTEKLTFRKVLPVMLSFAMFFTTMVLFERFMPATVTAAENGDLAVLKERLAEHNEIDWDLVTEQAKNKRMMIRHGIALYPRFYYFRVGEHTYYGSQGWKDYSRLSFYGLNSEGNSKMMLEYLLPKQELIHNFPQNSTFRAISCKTNNGYEDVLAVTIDTPNGEVYTYVRDPLPAFSCPVPEPVCTAIDNCY